jgi:hypothetical protein
MLLEINVFERPVKIPAKHTLGLESRLERFSMRKFRTQKLIRFIVLKDAYTYKKQLFKILSAPIKKLKFWFQVFFGQLPTFKLSICQK